MIDVGQTVGNYNITARLGEGGMGTVFLAQHPVIGSKVALKAIHPHLARNPEVVARFVTEARVVNQIGHDHIVDVYDFGTTPAGDFYFIMEYLHGEMLSERRGREVSFAPARALDIAAQIADALAASHERGVIHRDLKPDNIFLVTRDGRADFVKVLDFGLAKLTSASGAHPSYTTDAGMVIGTPYYMSPEQCEGRTELDHRSDVYALGVILFEMLTGRVPFAGEGYGEVMTKQISEPPPAARSLVPDLPPSLEGVLTRALAKRPDERFQSMAELRRVMLAVSDALAPVPVPALAERSAAVDPRPRRNRGGVFLLAAAAAALVAVASSGVRGQASQLFARSPGPKRPVTVRVNFSSDPSGAIVSKSDGSVLGVTPLSTEIPYGDKPVDYRVAKDGYSSKALSFVPNLPSPVFVQLARAEQPGRLDLPHLAPVPPPEGASPPPRAAVRRERHRGASAHPRAPIYDEDDVMPPSTD